MSLEIEHAKNFKLVPVSELLPYAKNARTHSKEQVEQIAASIKEFGFTNPILVDGERGIIAGHGRLAAAKKLGLKEVPVLELSHLSPTQKRAYVLADNKLALNAGWDEKLLAEELTALHLEDFDLDVVGFSDDELAELLPDFESGDGGAGDGSEQTYTKKIEAPIYEPKGEKPALSELYDSEKAKQLMDAIGTSGLPVDVQMFLTAAARRHVVFNYEKIAEYYAHAPAEVQDLMERSALVIIDFDKAIENGFVVMTKEIAEAYPKNED